MKSYKIACDLESLSKLDAKTLAEIEISLLRLRQEMEQDNIFCQNMMSNGLLFSSSTQVNSNEKSWEIDFKLEVVQKLLKKNKQS